jgi:hypothetical protein
LGKKGEIDLELLKGGGGRTSIPLQLLLRFFLLFLGVQFLLFALLVLLKYQYHQRAIEVAYLHHYIVLYRLLEDFIKPLWMVAPGVVQ